MFNKPLNLELLTRIELIPIHEGLILVLLTNPVSVVNFGKLMEQLLNAVEEPIVVVAMLKDNDNESFIDIFKLEVLLPAVKYWDHPHLGGLIFSARNPLVILAAQTLLRMKKRFNKIFFVANLDEMRAAYARIQVVIKQSELVLPEELLAALPKHFRSDD
jgi:hypothetical protein